MSSDKNRMHTRIASYLIGIKQGKILLGKRINVDFMNEHWSLPAGHVFEGESARDGLIREFLEECGVCLNVDDIEMIGVLHRSSKPFDYIDFIFKADLSGHHIINMEPDKCEKLEFFDIDNLPNPVSAYVKNIIEKSVHAEKPWIDEVGF